VAGFSKRSKTFFRLSPVDGNQTNSFAIQQGEITGRIDVMFHKPWIRSKLLRVESANFPTQDIRETLAEICYGTGTPPLFLSPSFDTVPFVRATDIKQGQIQLDNLLHISSEQPQKMDKCLLKGGEVIVVRSGANTGDSAFIPPELSGAYAAYDLILKFNDAADPKFIAYFLDTEIGRLQLNLVRGRSAQPHVNAEEVSNIRVVLPPLQKQIELVFAMDEAQSQRKQKLAEADALLSSLDDYLINALGLDRPVKDERKVFAMRLQDIQSQGRLNSDYFHPERILALRAMTTAAQTINCQKLEDVVSFVRDKIKKPENNYLGLAHVQSNTGELTNADDIATGDCFTFQNQDVLFARLRPYLNKVYRAEMDGCCSPEFHVLRIRDDNRLLPDYLAVILRSRLILAQTIHMMTGNTHPRLTNDDVINLLIPIPNIDLQEDISNEVQRRRDEARRLRSEAEIGWQEAKQWFEEQLLGVG